MKKDFTTEKLKEESKNYDVDLENAPPRIYGNNTHTHYTKEQGGACTPEKIIKIKRTVGNPQSKNSNSKIFPLLMLG